MTDVAKTLAERGSRYGGFIEQASVACAIKCAMMASRNYGNLAPDQWEALDMIAVKVARILTGDPDYADNWHDIAGYAKLVEDRLNLRTPAAPVTCERKSDARPGDGASNGKRRP